MTNNNTALFRIRNSGSFIADVVFTFLFQGEIQTHTTPPITPGMEYQGGIPRGVTNIHMVFHNKSAAGNPAFDEQTREYAVPSCFLITGDVNHPLVIPVPCSSFNYCNNVYGNYFNNRYF